MSEREKREVAYNCKYYLGDRPCVCHKQKGVVCRCEQYAPLKGNLLIIKLDAMGDVLRTTCLLPLIAKSWPGMRITWITRQESVPLLEHNPYISDIVPFGNDAFVHLSSRAFDRVINLDAGKISSGMAAMAKSWEKTGYILHEDGYVIATNETAGDWLRMGIFDDLKQSNKRSYQDIMCSILGLPCEGLEYVLELTNEEMHEGRKYLASLGVKTNKKIIGIHTGGGGRWPLKQWREEGFIDLITGLTKDLNDSAEIILLGGPLERELNKRIMRRVKGSVYDTGCDNGVRAFASMVDCCSVVLSGDSLAMHITLARRRQVVVLFGPTSHAEIELFGLGEKIVPDLGCLACYKTSCEISPNCMQSITIDRVKAAVLRQLAAAES
jgi:ADP-heptose:LPS heptosyltransferase